MLGATSRRPREANSNSREFLDLCWRYRRTLLRPDVPRHSRAPGIVMRLHMESPTPQQKPSLVCRPKRTGPLTAHVLGGGGSRGAVGVGLYRAIVELGIPIDLIVSSSIGAVNGALIAAGMAPPKLEECWKALRRCDVVGSHWQFLRLFTGSSSLYNNESLCAGCFAAICPCDRSANCASH